jgi:hypothetical protein
MPYQSASSLVIISAAFTLTGGILGGVNWLKEGKRQRDIGGDAWKHFVKQRDLALKEQMKPEK